MYLTQIENPKRTGIMLEKPEHDPYLETALSEYGVIVFYLNKEGRLVGNTEILKERSTWIIVAEENDTWADIERFIRSFSPEELKVIREG